MDSDFMAVVPGGRRGAGHFLYRRRPSAAVSFRRGGRLFADHHLFDRLLGILAAVRSFQPADLVSGPHSTASVANASVLHASILRAAFASALVKNLSVDQYRQFGVAKYLFGLATEDESGNAGAPVRGHEDQVAALTFGAADDSLIGAFADDCFRIT